VKTVVLPKKIHMDVFRHLRASPMVGGHMGRDRTYNCVRTELGGPDVLGMYMTGPRGVMTAS
jgi:hypothetical protein